MRLCSTLILLLAFILTPLAVGQDDRLTITVPVVDESAAASPIRTTGTAVFSEGAENGKAVCSYNCEIESRNVSQQPIVLLIMAEEFHCSNGLDDKRISGHEYLFERELLGPGKAITYPSGHCTSESMAEVSRRFAGLRSRCTMPCSWAALNPFASCIPKPTTSFSESAPVANFSSSPWPEMYSVTR